MAVLWDLVSRNQFDPFSAGMRGLQAGEAAARDQQKRSVLAELAQAGPNTDFNQAAMRLLPYDPQTANTLAQLGMQRDDRQFRREDRATDVAWRREESQRAQSNADRGFGLQQQQFGLQMQQANRPSIQMVEDENGNKRPVLINPNTGEMRSPVGDAGMPQPGPNNPYAPPGKTTDDQAKAGGFANRMVQSHNIITSLENINDGFAGNLGGILTANPSGQNSVMLNKVLSPERQKQVQAMRNFVNATLRRESGAVINPDEFQNAARQYFPMPGDSPEVIAQKRANREETTKGIMGAAGRGYRPPAEFNPGQQQQVQPGVPVRVNSIDEARRLPRGSTFIDPNGVTRVVP